MQEINCTPHELNLYHPEQYEYVPELRKNFLKPDQEPYLTFPKSGTVLSVEFAYRDTPHMIKGIVLKEQYAVTADSPTVLLPDFNRRTDWLIVSALYAMGVEQLGLSKYYNLLNVSGVVYMNPERPAPCGCTDIIVRSTCIE